MCRSVLVLTSAGEIWLHSRSKRAKHGLVCVTELENLSNPKPRQKTVPANKTGHKITASCLKRIVKDYLLFVIVAICQLYNLRRYNLLT